MQTDSSSVFITGATGFIGQRLVSCLLEQGHAVRAMVRPEKKSSSQIPLACEQIPVGLTDVDKLTGIVAESKAVIYCAGSVRGRNLTDFSVANIQGIQALIDASERASNAPPLLLVSSLAASQPQLSDYARSKNAGEQLLLGKPLLPWTIIRPPAVYGPGDQDMLRVLKMVRRGLLLHAGPRDQHVSLLHVDDLASAVVAWLLASQCCRHKTYAIDDGTPGGYTWDAIGEAVSKKKLRALKLPRLSMDIVATANVLFSKLLGYAPMFSPGKVRELIQPEWLCDNSSFTDATGWKPQLDLKQGAERLFKPD